jgi:hypothetical protein
MKTLSSFLKKSRLALVLLPVFMLTQCFQISHILDWKDDGSMDVRWVFRFSKALEQAQQGQQGQQGPQGEQKKDQSLGDMMEKEKKELPESLKGLVKNLNFKKIENEYDSGMEITFQVPNYEKFPFTKIKKEDFPLIPAYSPDKKQLVFHFEPMKKPEDEKKKTENKDAGKKVTEDGSSSPEQQDPNDQMNAMGKQITQLFLSSVRYQIFLGKKFTIDKVTIKKGKEEKKVEAQKIIDLTMIDLPLFAMYGEKEEPFDMIVYLK